MTDVAGLNADSPFVSLIGDLPVPTLLAHVHESWLAYAAKFQGLPPSFQKRSEPQLTQALGAYLRARQDSGDQPFPGDFFAELSDYVLNSNGLPKCVRRTDIEWRLYGVPGLIVEFKILDGKKSRRDKYLADGVMRFVVGRYGSSSTAGAMFALLRKGATNDESLIAIELQKVGSGLQCAAVKKSSGLLPAIAAFDSTHNRVSPHVTPFQLAHVFVPLP